MSPVQLAVAGLGRAGTYHLERLSLRDDCRVLGAFDECPEAVRKAAGLVAKCYSSWRELLTDAKVELVLIATPPATHAALAIEALAAGKSVLVESPLSLRLDEADSMLAVAKRMGRSLIVVSSRPGDDDFRAALSCVRSGALGRLVALKHVTWEYHPRVSPPSRAGTASPDERARSPATAQRPDHWRDHLATGGGALWEFGFAQFDQLLQLAGEPPQHIFTRFYEDAGQSAEDGFLALVAFPSGLLAQVEVCRSVAAPLHIGWTVAGTSGSYADLTQYTVTSEGEIVDERLPAVATDADDFYAAVFRHLRSGGPNPGPADEARQVIALVAAACRSAKTGRPEA
ncbi:MAG: Gfo/Idh/MocA family protein [Planctomycetaceae bacterium]